MKSPRLFICGALYVQLIRLVKLSLLRYISALDQGDWVFYENMGSYSQSVWMPFCGFPKPFVHYFIRDNEKYGKFLLAIDIESIIAGPHPE